MRPRGGIDMLILPIINKGKNGKKISNAKIELVNFRRLEDNIPPIQWF